jgi:hypothetical protein
MHPSDQEVGFEEVADYGYRQCWPASVLQVWNCAGLHLAQLAPTLRSMRHGQTGGGDGLSPPRKGHLRFSKPVVYTKIPLEGWWS